MTDKQAVMTSEQREKLLELAGNCWDRDWDVNQSAVDLFVAYVAQLLADALAHEAERVRKKVLEEAAKLCEGVADGSYWVDKVVAEPVTEDCAEHVCAAELRALAAQGVRV